MNPTERPAPGQAPAEKDILDELRRHAAGEADGSHYPRLGLTAAAAAEIDRLRRERDTLIDWHIFDLVADVPGRYIAFPNQGCEGRFATRDEARAYVRRMFGLD